MKKHPIFIVVLILFAFGATTLALQNGYDLFQKALAKERAEGNLEEAIALYQQVIKEAKDDALAAKAQLRIGFCYEKLGLSEAQKAFQKVVDNYPSQTETVKVAKEKLSILVKAKSVVEKGELEFGIRPVWSEAKWDIEGAPSPDGKYLSFVDWDTGDLAYRELATGKTHRLTDKGREKGSQESAYDSSWAPDSMQIAYCWENDQENYYDLRVIGLGDKEPRILHRVGYYDSWIGPSDWTPDGKHILVRLLENPFKFGIVSAADGSLHIIKEIDILEPHNNPKGGKFSPDGRYIAYDSQQNADSPNHDIFILSSDGKIDISVAPHPAHESVVGWAPDGNRLVFKSDRTGTIDLWLIAVENGMPKGDPILLRRNIGAIDPLGITRNGSFYYNIGGGLRSDVYTAAINPKTGEIISSPKKLALTFEGKNSGPVWSPDGKHIVYISKRRPSDRRILCIYSVKTGKIREIPYKNQVALPRWSPDGRFLLVYVLGEGIFKVDVQTEDFNLLLEPKGQQAPNISPDNNSLFYVRFDRENKVTHVLARDLKTGGERELYSTPFYTHNLVLSRDGKQLALMCSENPYENKKKKHALKIIPVDGGDVKERLSFMQVGRWGLVDVSWSPDGQQIFFTRISSEQNKDGPPNWELWRIPVESGDAENLGLMMKKLPTISIHPDGQQIVMSSYTIGAAPSPEVWVMENFLPEIDKKK
jgi:Tol biopolymer transport system component